MHKKSRHYRQLQIVDKCLQYVAVYRAQMLWNDRFMGKLQFASSFGFTSRLTSASYPSGLNVSHSYKQLSKLKQT
ncbi:hypothetical protein J26TS2_26750 [Shouchella clausii]|nr:hypothetical protein J26TS2_26750 [Shouchella clausii]